jgi:cytochrome c oxidase subunit II
MNSECHGLLRPREPLVSRTLVRRLLGAPLALVAGLSHARHQYNLPPPETSSARLIYSLHTEVWVVCAVICVVVFAVMFYSLVRFRRSRGHEAKQFTGFKPLEITWTVVPVLIVIALSIPATATLLALRDTSNPDVTVKITGYQWKWRYDYLNEDLGFYSELSTPREQIEGGAPKGEHYLLEVDHPMVVPVGKKIRILMTANDVIHSWWVPAFGVKQDGIPGFVRDSWFRVDEPGTYRGQCAELCGKDHGFMPVVVKAVSEDDYRAWVAAERAASHAASAANAAAAGKTYTLDELKAGGEKVYLHACVACHQASGQGTPPAFPALAHGQIADGPIAGTIDIVVNGSQRNPAMIPWKGQLSDLEIAEVITYVRNSFGNDRNDLVQPKDIAAVAHRQ